jgi:RNA polymerase sigma-70 factor (ECF subfamily)
LSATQNIEERLVEHLLSRDQKRFGYVYDYFSADIFGVIFKIVQDEKIAEDVLQDTFLKIWNASASYSASKSRLFTWILNIARNTAIDYLRSKQGKIDKKLQTVDDFVESDSPHFLTDVQYTGINRVVQTLEKDQFDIINLGFFEGYTQVEIAKKLNIPLGTVKTRCRSALAVLRVQFDKDR